MAAHVEVLTVLRNDILRKYFTRHLVTSLSEENIEFWRDVQKYKASSDKTRQTQCAVMLNKYICKRAPLEVNIDGWVKEAILEKTSSGLSLSSNLFDDAENQVLFIMEHNQIPLFKQSELYTIATKKLESSKKSKKFLMSKKHKKQISASSGGSTPLGSFEPLNFIEQQNIPETDKTPEVSITKQKTVRRSSSCSSIQKRVVAISTSPKYVEALTEPAISKKRKKRFSAKDKSARALGSNKQTRREIRKSSSSRKLGVSKDGGSKLRRSKSKIIFGSVPKLLSHHKKSNSDDDVVIAQPVHTKKRRKKSNDSSGSKKRLLPGEISKTLEVKNTSGVSFSDISDCASSAPMTSLLDALEKKPLQKKTKPKKIDIELDMSYMNPKPETSPDAGSGAAIIGMFEMELTETMSECGTGVRQDETTSSSDPDQGHARVELKRARSDESSSAWHAASTRVDEFSGSEPTTITMALARKESFEESTGQTITRPTKESVHVDVPVKVEKEPKPRKKKKKTKFLKLFGAIMK